MMNCTCPSLRRGGGGGWRREEREFSPHPEIIQFHGRMNQTSTLPLSASPPWKELYSQRLLRKDPPPRRTQCVCVWIYHCVYCLMIEYIPFIYLFDSSIFNEELRHVCFLSDHTFKWESWCTSLLWCNQNGSLSFEIDNNHFMSLFCSHPLHVLSYLTKTSRPAAVNKWLTLHDWPLSKYFAFAESVKEHGRS